MVNIEKEIRAAVDTGEVVMGERETLKAVRAREVKLVICAANCSAELKSKLEKHAKIGEVPIYNFSGSSLDLGAICGRPHLISMLGVVSSGDSDVFKLRG